MRKCMFERTWWQSIDCGTNRTTLKKQICRSHSNHSSPRFASIPSIEPESARSPIYARSRSPVARTSKYNNTIHHTCIHCTPPIHFVNNPQISTTPTILKGQTVGLTRHTLYGTHPLPWHLGWNQNSTHSLRKPRSHISRTYHIKESNRRSRSPHALWNPP